MVQLLLSADPLGLATQGVASYLFYVRALGYAIAAVVCIVGSLSVYTDFIEGDPEVRMKVMKLAFSCVFLVTASYGLPAFFGMDSSSQDVLSTAGVSSSDTGRGLSFTITGRTRDLLIGPPVIEYRPVVITPVPYPGGGNAVIWGRERI